MAICGFEAFGNCRFSHFDEDGNAVGRPHYDPSVIIAAVSEKQAKVTLRVANWLFSGEMRREFGIDIGKEAITGLRGRASIEVLSASFRSAEGRPTSFALLNETHHWVPGNGGPELYDTIDGNIAKGAHGQSWKMMVSNAFMPGEDSVLERTREAYARQQERFASTGVMDVAGIYYDSLEAASTVPMDPDVLRTILPEIRGDSVWLSVDQFMSSIMKTNITVQRSRRMYLNQIVSSADALFEKADLVKCIDRVPLRDGETITLGFDGGRRHDATALIACRVSDRKAFMLDLWEKPPTSEDDSWRLESDVVDSAGQEAFRRYNVLAFYADVHQWESEINDWSDQFRDRLVVRASAHSSIGWDMRNGIKRVTLMNESIVAAVQQHAFRLDGDPRLMRHILNVRRHNTNIGVSFRKESRDSPKKIDAYAATLLAYMAALDVAEKGKIPQPKKSRRLLRRR